MEKLNISIPIILAFLQPLKTFLTLMRGRLAFRPCMRCQGTFRFMGELS